MLKKYNSEQIFYSDNGKHLTQELKLIFDKKANKNAYYFVAAS